MGLSDAETAQFLRVSAAAAGSDLEVGVSLVRDSWPAMRSLLEHAEKAGCSHAFLGFPPGYRPASIEQVVSDTRSLLEGSAMPVIIHGAERFPFPSAHRSRIPFDLFDQLAELPSVVGIKVNYPDPAMAVECLKHYQGRLALSLGSPNLLGLWPLLADQFEIRWCGFGIWEFWQSPEKPRIVDYLELVTTGKQDQARSLWWELWPDHVSAMEELGAQHRAGAGDPGMNHWPLRKYAAWCVGGNGGLTRQPALALTSRQMAVRREALAKIGINVEDNDDTFFSGRAHARA